MKEKEVVCKYCGQPRKVAVKKEFLFLEEWIAGQPIDRHHPRLGHIFRNPYNLTKEEWQAAQPKLSRDQLIVQLANRVAVLEAALAEKGGVR